MNSGALTLSSKFPLGSDMFPTNDPFRYIYNEMYKDYVAGVGGYIRTSKKVVKDGRLGMKGRRQAKISFPPLFIFDSSHETRVRAGDDRTKHPSISSDAIRPDDIM